MRLNPLADESSLNCWRSLRFLVIRVSVSLFFFSLCMCVTSVRQSMSNPRQRSKRHFQLCVCVCTMPSLELTRVQSGRRVVLGVINLPRLAWVPFLQSAWMTNSNARLVFACLYHDAVTDSRTVSVEGTNKIVKTWVRIVTVCYNEPPHLAHRHMQIGCSRWNLNRISYARDWTLRERRKNLFATHADFVFSSSTKKRRTIFFLLPSRRSSRTCRRQICESISRPRDSNAGGYGNARLGREVQRVRYPTSFDKPSPHYLTCFLYNRVKQTQCAYADAKKKYYLYHTLRDSGLSWEIGASCYVCVCVKLDITNMLNDSRWPVKNKGKIIARFWQGALPLYTYIHFFFCRIDIL